MSGPDDVRVMDADRDAAANGRDFSSWEGFVVCMGSRYAEQQALGMARHRTEATAEKDRLLGIAVEALEAYEDLMEWGFANRVRVDLVRANGVAALAQIRAVQGGGQ
jgi:hypothetical protein